MPLGLLSYSSPAGKSAKKNCLSGFVPFLQISQNEHKRLVEQSPSGARTHIYYRNVVAREEAMAALMKAMHSEEMTDTDIEVREIHYIHNFDEAGACRAVDPWSCEACPAAHAA